MRAGLALFILEAAGDKPITSEQFDKIRRLINGRKVKKEQDFWDWLGDFLIEAVN